MNNTQSYHHRREAWEQEAAAQITAALGFVCESDTYRYLMRREQLQHEERTRAMEAQAAADLATAREAMAPYAAPEGPEDDEDDIEEEEEEEELLDDDDDDDDETPDVDEEDGDDLDPGDVVEFAAEVEELRQVEALAEIAEGLPTSAGWQAIIARALVILATVAPAPEVLRISRGISPSADSSAVVEMLLIHCRRWLFNKTLRN